MRKAYRRQPPRGTKVAAGSPLGRFVTAQYLFNRDFNSAVPGKSGKPVVTTGPKFVNGPRGWYALGNGSGKVVTNLLPADLGMTGAAPRTIITEFDLGDTNAGKCVLSFGDTSTRPRSQFTIMIGTGYRGVQVATYANDFNIEAWSASGTSARVFLGVTYDGNLTVTMRAWCSIYETGQVTLKTQAFTLPSPLDTGTTFPLNLMGGGTYNFPSMDTALYYVSMIGGKCLTPAEIDSLYADRYQLMEPPRRFPYAALAAAPVAVNGTALVSGAAVASSAGSISASGGATAPVSGTAASFNAGTVSAQGSARTSVIGAEVIASAGNVIASAGTSATAFVPSAGSAIVTGSVSATGSASFAVTGAAAKFDAGFVSAQAAGNGVVQIVGASSSFSAGTVQAKASATASIIGAGAVFSAGRIAANAGVEKIDVLSVPQYRTVVFEGSKRVVAFEGSKRVVTFEGSKRLVRFQ
jgi:hypothetical protein